MPKTGKQKTKSRHVHPKRLCSGLVCGTGLWTSSQAATK